MEKDFDKLKEVLESLGCSFESCEDTGIMFSVNGENFYISSGDGGPIWGSYIDVSYHNDAENEDE